MNAVATRETPEIRGVQERKFAELMRSVLESNLFYQRKYEKLGFASGRPAGLSDRDDLPLVRPAELLADVQQHPPLGTNLTHRLSRYTRMHHALSTTGEPLRWLDTVESWSWWLDCWRKVYEAAGVAPDDRVVIVQGDRSSVGLWAAFEAGQHLGALMIPDGSLGIADRVDTVLESRATVLVASPLDARALAAEVRRNGNGAEEGALRSLIQVAESIGCLRGEHEAEAWPDERFSHVGAIEIGAWGFGCGHGDFLHVNEEEFIVEVLDPHSGRRVEPDDEGVQHGELVLTNLGRVGSPLIRYATGQLVELSRPACPCGRRTAVTRCATS
jgi:phenylacetate-CoA ligase